MTEQGQINQELACWISYVSVRMLPTLEDLEDSEWREFLKKTTQLVERLKAPEPKPEPTKSSQPHSVAPTDLRLCVARLRDGLLQMPTDASQHGVLCGYVESRIARLINDSAKAALKYKCYESSIQKELKV